MTSMPGRSLGILNLERGLPPGVPVPQPRFTVPFDFPVIWETVEGAWAETVIRGDPALESAYLGAAQRLVNRGAVVVSSNCGFTIRHQAALAASVNVPVVTSSLLLLPALLRQVPDSAKIAVLTADSTCLTDDVLGVHDPAERSRVVIGGIEGGRLLKNEMKRPPPVTEISEIEADVVECVTRLQAEHSDIAVLLFECTGFPMVAPAIRRLTNLPIYDISTLCEMTMASIP